MQTSPERLDFEKVCIRLEAIKINLIEYRKMIINLDDQYEKKIKELEANGLHVGAMRDFRSPKAYPETHKLISELAQVITAHISTIEGQITQYNAVK